MFYQFFLSMAYVNPIFFTSFVSQIQHYSLEYSSYEISLFGKEVKNFTLKSNSV
jgi:hypothetical protein